MDQITLFDILFISNLLFGQSVSNCIDSGG